MEDYKKILYDTYISTHNKNVLAGNSLSYLKPVAIRHYYLRHLPEDKNARILEIGCGDGYLVHQLQEHGYTNASGIDVSIEQIGKANEMDIKNLVCEDFTEFLKHDREPFDMIVARDVIEHFTKQEAFDLLLLINQNLKKGGKFLMQVPNGQGLFYTSVYYADFTHEMAYSHYSIKQLLFNTGFTSVECYPTDPVPHGLKSWVRAVLWKFFVLNLKFWKMVETGSPYGIFTQNIIAVAVK